MRVARLAPLRDPRRGRARRLRVPRRLVQPPAPSLGARLRIACGALLGQLRPRPGGALEGRACDRVAADLDAEPLAAVRRAANDLLAGLDVAAEVQPFG